METFVHLWDGENLYFNYFVHQFFHRTKLSQNFLLPFSNYSLIEWKVPGIELKQNALMSPHRIKGKEQNALIKITLSNRSRIPTFLQNRVDFLNINYATYIPDESVVVLQVVIHIPMLLPSCDGPAVSTILASRIAIAREKTWRITHGKFLYTTLGFNSYHFNPQLQCHI